MTERMMKAAVALGSSAILMHISISLSFISLLLGLLFIPPAAVFICIFAQGLPMIRREVASVLDSGRDFLLISISKEHITLEPQFR